MNNGDWNIISIVDWGRQEVLTGKQRYRKVGMMDVQK